jgi:outer membrane protein
MERLYEGNITITVENTIANVILAYQNILFQTENVKLAEEVMNLSKDRYEQEEMKAELGTSVTYNLLQAKNADLQDQSSYLSAQSSYNNAVRQLNFLMAVDTEKTYSVNLGFETISLDFNYQDLEQKLLSNNAQLKNQYINLELSKLEVKSARSAYYPTLSLGASAGCQVNDYQYDINTQLNSTDAGFTNSVSANVSYNIYEGGSRKIALQASKISLEIMDIQTDEMKHELQNQLAQKFELYNVRKKLLQLAKENLEAAWLNLDLSKQR